MPQRDPLAYDQQEILDSHTAALERLETGQNELRASVTELRAELRGSVAELRTELRGSVAELRGSVAELRTEVRGSIAELAVSQAELKGGLDTITRMLGQLVNAKTEPPAN